MKLLKARIRGVGALSESAWFELSPRLNLFQFAGPGGAALGKKFLRILQTINPPYAVCARQPFADFPQSITVGGQTRRINPAKKTIVLAVFNTTADLVRELSPLGDWFYETDRIEVGRRLDYSRWVNFVELASSTRYSEISSALAELLGLARQLAPAGMAPPVALATLQPTERIVGPLQDQLLQWLHQLPPKVQQSAEQQIAATRTAILRAAHFQDARVLVRRHLPPLVVLGVEPELLSVASLLQLIARQTEPGKEHSFIDTLNEQLSTLPFLQQKLQLADFAETTLALSPLEQMQAKAALAIAYSRIACGTEPILLFAAPERRLSADLHAELADFIQTVATTCQCLYCYGEIDIMLNKADYKHYKNGVDALLPMAVDEAT